MVDETVVTNVANIYKYENGTFGSVNSVSVPIGEFDSHKCARYNFVYYSLSEKCNRLGAGGGVGGLSTTVSSTIKTCHHVITEMLLTMAIHAHNPFDFISIKNLFIYSFYFTVERKGIMCFICSTLKNQRTTF
jgi:hypothetical protein